VYVVDISELIPHRIVTNIAGMFLPRWPRDGKWIYFLAGTTESPRVYRCPEKGGNATVISSGPAFGVHESFDGEALYFVDALVDIRLKMEPVNPLGPDSLMEGMPLLKDAAL
jgi:hypothetical protein